MHVSSHPLRGSCCIWLSCKWQLFHGRPSRPVSFQADRRPYVPRPHVGSFPVGSAGTPPPLPHCRRRRPPPSLQMSWPSLASASCSPGCCLPLDWEWLLLGEEGVHWGRRFALSEPPVGRRLLQLHNAPLCLPPCHIAPCSIAALRLSTYSQLEYITAAMLARHVKAGGARVLQVRAHAAERCHTCCCAGGHSCQAESSAA